MRGTHHGALPGGTPSSGCTGSAAACGGSVLHARPSPSDSAATYQAPARAGSMVAPTSKRSKGPGRRGSGRPEGGDQTSVGGIGGCRLAGAGAGVGRRESPTESTAVLSVGGGKGANKPRAHAAVVPITSPRGIASRLIRTPVSSRPCGASPARGATLVSRLGFEPRTSGLKVRCSAA